MWHVLHTAPNTEQQVRKFLAVHGLTSYAPQFRQPAHTRAGSVRSRWHRWIFPGYVFFQAAEGFTSWHLVRTAPGVRHILSDAGQPAAMDDAVIEELQRRLAGRRLPHPGSEFHPGQRVIIQRGPMQMLDALFECPLRAADRVQILVYLMGRRVSAQVDPSFLRAAG